MRRPQLVALFTLGLASVVSGGAARGQEKTPAPSAEASAPSNDASPSAATRASETDEAKKEANKKLAQELLIKGAEAVYSLEWKDAEGFFREAWKLERSYAAACNLGDAELQNGKPADAATHLRYCVDHVTEAATGAEAKRVKARFEEARKRVAVCKVRVSVAGANVTLDGKPVEMSGTSAEVFVEPGEREFHATKHGLLAASDVCSVGKGEIGTVMLDLKEAPPPPPPPSAPPPPAAPPIPPKPPQASALPEARSQYAATFTPGSSATDAQGSMSSSGDSTASSSLRTGLLIGGGVVTLAGLGVGLGLWKAHSDTEDEANALRDQLTYDFGPDPCHWEAQILASECATLKGYYPTLQTFKTAYIVSFAVGAAAGAATTLGYFLTRSSRASKTGTMLLPSVTGDAGGLVLVGVW